ncbi:uncharacterized protein METZ01_LOCUS330204, partial [marine metagenome]
MYGGTYGGIFVGKGVQPCAWNSHGTPESTTEGCEIVVYDDEGGEALQTGIVILGGGGSNCLMGQSIFTKDETIHIIEEDDSGSAIVIIEKANKTTVIVDGEVVAIWGHGLDVEYSPTHPAVYGETGTRTFDMRIAAPGIDDGDQGQFYEESSYKPIRVPVLTPEAYNHTGPCIGENCCLGIGTCIPKLDGSLITDGSGGWILATHDEVSDSDNVIIDTEDAWLIVDDSKLEMFMPKDMDVLEYMNDQPTGGKGPTNQTDNNNSEEQSQGETEDCVGVCWGTQQNREDQSDTSEASFRTGIVVIGGGTHNCMFGIMIFDNNTDDDTP